MKREFLKTMGLTEEQIDKVMAENGNDINDLRTQVSTLTTERDGIKDQLKQRDADINELKKSSASAEELKKQVTDLEDKYKKETGELTAKLEKQNFDAKLDLALAGKVKNVKAAKALLDVEKIKLKEDALDGLEAQLTALKTSDAYLFTEAPTPPNPKGNPPAGGKPGEPGKGDFRSAIAANISKTMEKK